MGDPVTLYLIRHGLAADRGADYPDDSQRPLTDRGIGRLKETALGLVALDVHVDEFLTSPFLRAHQTAEVLARGFPRPPRITNVPELAVGGRVPAQIAALARFPKRRALALVGHAPDIGVLAARLIGSRHPIDFRKGAVCCIEVDALPPEGNGDLRWFLTPRMLRTIGKTG